MCTKYKYDLYDPNNYAKSAVLDLATGKIIAEELREKSGFCPVGFYVPDWWDLHDGSILPGSPLWSKDSELPDGTFGPGHSEENP